MFFLQKRSDQTYRELLVIPNVISNMVKTRGKDEWPFQSALLKPPTANSLYGTVWSRPALLTFYWPRITG